MNYVRCKVVGNDKDVYIPVQEGKKVYLATAVEIKMALGLDQVKNPIPAGYIKMYEGANEQILPVNFNSHFLIGPEGAHLNISGISGLASKTSYAMFLMKAIQDVAMKGNKESVAFVMMNVKGTDLLKIDEMNEREDELEKIKKVYDILGMEMSAFKQVSYYYPYSKDFTSYTASENNRHPAKMHRNNTAVVFFSRHIWSFPTFFRNLTDRTAPDIRHSGNRFGRLCLNLKNRDNR